MNQNLTPLADALREQIKQEYIPFDVPGHKGNLKALSEYFGEDCLLLDKNSRAGIDYLCQPRGVIREAEALAFFAEHIAFRNNAIFKDKFSGGRTADTHFLFFGADGESGSVFGNDKRGDTASTFALIGHRHDDISVSVTTVGDEDFGSV